MNIKTHDIKKFSKAELVILCTMLLISFLRLSIGMGFMPVLLDRAADFVDVVIALTKLVRYLSH